MPHPSPDRLLPFIDGEVGEKEFTLLAAHMEASWNCRVKKARLEESIADIVDLGETLALLEVYGDGPKWSGFDRRLREAAALKANTKKRTFLEIVRGSIADRRPLKRALAYGAPVLAAALILISVFLPTMTLSAADILDRAVVADGKLSGSAERPIVQRGFVISAGGQTTKAVSWRDTVNNRSKIEIEPGSSGERALRDIASTGFPIAGIFSAKAFLEWGKNVGTIADKPRTVSSGNGETAYEILLTPDIDEQASQLDSASITVRAKDWVIVGHEFTFREEPSPRQISIIQENVRMLASKEVPAGIFDDNLHPSGSKKR